MAKIYSLSGILVGQHARDFRRIQTASLEVPAFFVDSDPDKRIPWHSFQMRPDGGMEHVGGSGKWTQRAIGVSQSGGAEGCFACAIRAVEKVFSDAVLSGGVKTEEV